MMEGSLTVHLAYLSAVLMIGSVLTAQATTLTSLDSLPDGIVGVPVERTEIGMLKPPRELNRDSVTPLSTGNPLWFVPLAVLTATQQRPIFSASRRPPQPIIVISRVEPVSLPAAKAEPEHPQLSLIGAVLGDEDAIAVFLNRSNQGIVRLRVGQAHEGWVLSSVLGRQVALKKADQVEVLVMKREDLSGERPSLFGSPVTAGKSPGDLSLFAPYLRPIR